MEKDFGSPSGLCVPSFAPKGRAGIHQPSALVCYVELNIMFMQCTGPYVRA